MSNEDHIIAAIEEDWNSSPNAELCLKIVELVRSDKTFVHITLPLISKLLERDDYENILAVLNYLSSPRIKFLKERFELIDDNETIEVDVAEVSSALETGYLVNPKTGEEIEHFSEDIFVYYQPR